MRRKKKTTIVTFESRERTTNRSGAPSVFAWCERCGRNVLMVTPHDPAATAGAHSRAVFRDVESGEIHVVEVITTCSSVLRAYATKSESEPGAIATG